LVWTNFEASKINFNSTLKRISKSILEIEFNEESGFKKVVEYKTDEERKIKVC
jgi:hypothetical protein